jgi:hypothetical protein
LKKPISYSIALTLRYHILLQSVPKSNPQLAAQLGPDTGITQCMLAFSNYETGHRKYNKSEIWEPKTNTLKYDCGGKTGSWSYSDGGNNMTFVVDYQNKTHPKERRPWKRELVLFTSSS